ncbi:MAG: hypothetical protein H7Y18_02820 [Clostridiaceae bacterium]|nr:hypothetical protein [Clostridiaceae bacterium]
METLEISKLYAITFLKGVIVNQIGIVENIVIVGIAVIIIAVIVILIYKKKKKQYIYFIEP